ncbi:molybdopterin-dependent oxidoreductase [Haliea sp. E1-2-M8]|uniref:molybdopterin-containing oxidoreductase family protein n=1 Tax=Haliea sp. E1-2-M8 TaxID=3064706 RepID=UPI002719853E|nr:molybdopterin-dependent oxidoreductase [Haliea sp. E1-2-M8]MDO8863480.1 molybdopterin-dependent oxidoreductase [Haliea sp. E1-2-M8]
MTTTRPSICRLCIAHCGILATVEAGKLTRVTGDSDNPLFKGYTCPKGRALPELHNHPDRLLQSQKRSEEGDLEPIPSTQAAREIADQLGALVAKHGPRSVAVYIGTNSLPYPGGPLVAYALLRALGSPMFFTANTIDQPNKQIAQALHGIWQGGDQDFERADTWLLIGVNPVISKAAGIPCQNPAQKLKDAVKRGMKLIVVDPRTSETASRAAIHLQPRPGEDATILAGMIRVIIRESLYDQDFVAQHSEGMDSLAAQVEPFTPEVVAQRAGIDAETLARAARLFASGTSGGVNTGTGASFSMNSNLTEYLALALTTLCGRWPRADEPVTRPNGLLPPWQPRAQACAPFPAWGFGEQMRVRGLGDSVAGMPTAALAEDILLPGPGQVRALICLGGNPMTAWPDQRKTMAAMESLELLVTFDPQLSETSQLANYVIAPRLTLETPGMSQPAETGKYYGLGMGIPGSYGQISPAIVDPPANADLVEEWQFLWDVARHLDLDLDLGMAYGFGSYAESRMSGFQLGRYEALDTEGLYRRMCANSRLDYDEVAAHPHGLLRQQDVLIAPGEADCTARLRLDDPTMMAELQVWSTKASAASADDIAYPFRLIPRRSNNFMNSTGRNIAKLRAGKTWNPAFMHPEDIARLGIETGATVCLRSPWDHIQAIAEADPTLRPGVIAMTHGFGGLPGQEAQFRELGSNTGRLLNTEVDFDPYTGMPRMGNVPIAVTPSSDQ